MHRIGLVKPEKARGVEDMIISLARSGQLGGRVDEPKLINLLEQITGSTKKETKITVGYVTSSYQGVRDMCDDSVIMLIMPR